MLTKRLIVLRGLPGSGKTHVRTHSFSQLFNAHDNKLDTGYIICSADDFFTKDGEYHFDPLLLPEAHKACFMKFVEAVNAETPHILIDNTNIHAAEYAPYMTYAQAFDYTTEIVTVWASVETAMKRQTHEVPLNIMLRMYSDLVNENVPSWYNHTILLKEDSR